MDKLIRQLDNELNKNQFHPNLAISYVFITHYPRLCQITTKAIGKNRGMDLVHNAFIQFLNERKPFTSERELAEYLYEAVKSNYVTDLQDNEQLPWVSMENVDFPIPEEIIPSYNLEKVVNKLPAQRKRIIQLLFWEGLTSMQAADVMGLSRQTVINQKIRALKTLKRLVLSYLRN